MQTANTKTKTRAKSQSNEHAPDWRTYADKHVVVHALDGTYSARRAPVELREAERAAETLEKLLDPPDTKSAAKQIDIYLSDPLVELPPGVEAALPVDGPEERAGAGTRPQKSFSPDSIVRVIQPEAPGEPVTWPVTRLLVTRWFGKRVRSAPFLLDGVAGVVAARAGTGPTIKEIDDTIKTEMEDGNAISIFGDGRWNKESPPVIDNAATSFVAFLIEGYGAKAVSKFLATYDPERRDQSTIAIFQRPLGALEEIWQQGLKRKSNKRSAFMIFFRQIGPLIRPYWQRQTELYIYAIVALVYGLLMPLANKYLFGNIFPMGEQGLSEFAVFMLLITLAYLINATISMRRAWVSAWVNSRISMDLQGNMFWHLQRLGHNYYGQAKLGDIMSRMSSDLGTVQGAMMTILNSAPFSIVSAIAGGIVLFILNPFLTLLVLAVVPIFTFSFLALRTRLQKASYERQKLSGETVAALQENLSAQSVIKAFGLEERAAAQYLARLMALFRSTLRLTVIGSIYSTSMDLTVTLAQLLVLGVGGYMALTGQLGTTEAAIGTLVAFFGLMPSLFGPVAALAGLGQTVATATGSLDRVNELLDEPVAIANKPDAIALPPLAGEIRFEHVTFSYGPDRPILRDLNLEIPAGSNVAIVGPSGSGKSTIVNLLLRFWDPDSGEEGGRVLYDGHDLRDVTVELLRGQVGLVFQDTFVFDTTLRENIGLAKPGATDAEIEDAARAARLDDYIASLPAGFDTVLGERGVRMSGGQRQRLAIARAMLRDPRVLVLDEATSALDSQTERGILDTLAVLSKGRTTVSITHRLSLAAAADRVFVLNQGVLVEQGAHAELVNAGGLYQRLYEEQTGYVSTGGAERPRINVEVDRLRAIPIFSGLGGAALSALAGQLMLEKYSEGEDIVRQGDPGDKLYVINRGQVEVLVNTNGTKRHVNTLNEGDYFGEMALLMGEPRSATVRAAASSELFSLDRVDFRDLVLGEADVRLALAENLGPRYKGLLEATSAPGTASTGAEAKSGS